MRIERGTQRIDRARRALSRAVLFAVLGLGLALGFAQAQVCTTIDSGALYFGDRIGLEVERTLGASVVDHAIGQWSRCANYGSGFPVFDTDSPGDRVIRVAYRPGAIGRGHCGTFSRDGIVLYDQMVHRLGRRVSCGSLALNLAHELGHVLGLADAPVETRCESAVMSWITLRNISSRGVVSAECQAAGQVWLTRSELARLHGEPETFASFTVGAAR